MLTNYSKLTGAVMDAEVWVAIPGYVGYYEASTDGGIRSVVRYKRMGRGIGAIRPVGGIRLKPTKTTNGYFKLTVFTPGGRKITALWHRLICTAFHGQPPSPAHHVNHKNGIKTDNRPENLEWATPLENNTHAIEVLGVSRSGEAGGNAKLTEAGVREIARRRAGGESCIALGREFGVTVTQVSRICTGKSWRGVIDDVVPAYVYNEDRANRRGEHSGRAKLTADRVREMRALYASGVSAVELSKRFEVSHSTAYSACVGLTWRSVK